MIAGANGGVKKPQKSRRGERRRGKKDKINKMDMSKETTIEDCKIIDLQKIHDPRGNLTPIEGGLDVPFDIKRVYYLYAV